MAIKQSYKRNTSKRHYRNITPDTLVEYNALEITEGNGEAAVRSMYPELLRPDQRAYQIRAKSENETALEYIDKTMQQIGVDAINRIGMMVNSNDETIATRNAHYVTDHIKGKAMQKSINLSVKTNIQSVLD